MDKRRLIQIGIPVLILTAVAGIWFVKNSNGKSPADEARPPLEITGVDLEEIKGKGLPVIIDFGSDSCLPCRQMAPALERIYTEMQGKAVIHFIDVWKNLDAARGFPVQVIPTQLFFTAGGEPYRPGAELAEEIPFTFYKKKDTGEHVFTVHKGGLTYEQMRAILMDMGVRE